MDNQTVVEKLRAALPDAIQSTNEFRGQLNVIIKPESLLEVAGFLRGDSELRYNFLEQLCGVDYLGRTPRFEMVYHLISHANRHRICLKAGLPERNPRIASLTPLWSTANYQEREAFDMFGIVFDGHPSLERILLPEDWEGYPQRKDVPLGGEEVAFTFSEERIYAQKTFAKE